MTDVARRHHPSSAGDHPASSALDSPVTATRGPTAAMLFGKHPAWDDHINIDLPHPALAGFRDMLYYNGIAKNIGKWNRLPPHRKLEHFDHLIAWQPAPRACMLALLSASSDGKGRTYYPLVCAAFLDETDLTAVSEELLAHLEAFEHGCQVAKKRTAVMDQVHATDAAFRATVDARPPTSGAASNPLHLLRDRMMTQDGYDAGLLRVLDELARTDPPAARWPRWMRLAHQRETSPPPIHLRLPKLAETTLDAMKIWVAAVGTRLGGDAPVFVSAPRGEAWLDLVIGAPSERELFCLRAGTSAIPLTTSISSGSSIDGQQVSSNLRLPGGDRLRNIVQPWIDWMKARPTLTIAAVMALALLGATLLGIALLSLLL